MNPLRSARRFALVVTLAALGILPGEAAAAPPAPAWSVTSLALPTHVGAGEAFYNVVATNSGGAPSDGSPITITDALPAGLKLVPGGTNGYFGFDAFHVVGPAQKVDTNTDCDPTPPASCTIHGTVSEPLVVEPGESVFMTVPVVPEPGAPAVVVNQVSVSGGGAASASASEQTITDAEPASFAFQQLRSAIDDAAGAAETRAGAHPYRLELGFQLGTNPSLGPALPATPGASPKNVSTALPPGLVVNPRSTPVRCTETQLESIACPAASAVGVAHLALGYFGYTSETPGRLGVPVFNMVPSPGAPAELGFEAAGLGFPVHLRGGVDPAGDYALTANARELLQFGSASGATVELWGDPSDPSHDPMRGYCIFNGGDCPTTSTQTPFLTMPSACSGPLVSAFSVESWEEPGRPITAAVPTRDQAGNPVGVGGCGQLAFGPSIAVEPDSSTADSPVGLHVNLHVPQHEGKNSIATANLRDVTVVLPEGMVVNPSAADGLAACTASQIDLESARGAQCPDASKVGTVSIDTPLLGKPLEGSVFLAKQGENPFGSLIALYISIDDPATGVVVKLAGRVEPDPVTGQLTATFESNPQLPVEDVDVDFFGGPRAALTSPRFCGRYTTVADLVPWTAPQGGDARASSSFDVGGACAGSESQLPHQPAFDAGTTVPLAGSYSPFVLKVSRENGTQKLRSINVDLPPGLTGRLAGLQPCSDSGIAAAAARGHLGEGALEQASPSCPQGSEVGTVVAGAGSGSPLYVPGHVYLAGPYKGAPISFAFVTPAVAGPFDLGTIVVRAAAYVDPTTARISVKSDAIPTILHGIPLDLRSIAVHIDRSRFTLNPTSCDAMSITGEAISTPGSSSPLARRFQVGGCNGLPFEPTLSLKLKGSGRRGAYPQLTAVFKAKPGEANTRKLSVALPHSEFLAQNHIRTICTRVQFAAHACPQGSIYGKAMATTPLLDEPLRGPVYLRSSDNPLPDIVLELNGQVDAVLVGRVDSVNGGIRNTFSSAPDVPVSKVVLKMQGGKKGLLVNSRNICRSPGRARVVLIAHSGKTHGFRPPIANSCGTKSNQAGH